MHVENWTLAEQSVILQCLRAIVEGPWIEDWEFQTRLGITRPEMHAVAAAWPPFDQLPGRSGIAGLQSPGKRLSAFIENWRHETGLL